MKNTLTTKQRTTQDSKKAKARRVLVSNQFQLRDLVEIFGRCIQHRFITNPRDARIGKNYFSNHFHAGARNPAGSKLLRRFIRDSSKEQVTVRRAYAALTGRHYDHLNNPEQ